MTLHNVKTLWRADTRVQQGLAVAGVLIGAIAFYMICIKNKKKVGNQPSRPSLRQSSSGMLELEMDELTSSQLPDTIQTELDDWDVEDATGEVVVEAFVVEVEAGQAFEGGETFEAAPMRAAEPPQRAAKGC